MRPVSFKTLVVTLIISSTSISYISCRNKAKETDNTTTNVDTSASTTTAPVEISTDDSLKAGVRDATKDYTGVNATVDNGEITLTGNITKDRLPKLMMALNSLHPKKINNNLTVK